MHPLSVDDVQYFETRFFLVPGCPTHYVDAKVSVIRQRMIGTSFDEQLTVFNHSDQPMELTIRMDAGNDFADLFEIKNVDKKGELLRRCRRWTASAGLPSGKRSVGKP